MSNYKEEYDTLKKSYDEMEERLEGVNKKLLRSEQLKSDFLSNIKNEINNPLTSILGLLNQIIANPDDPKKNATKAKLIHNEAYALNFQMMNIFHAAEIEAGQSYPELSKVNLNELITHMAESYQHQVEKKNIEFELQLEADEVLVTDREKLEMILLNLVSNAIKFSHDDDKVIISTQNENGGVSINVKDHGVGIEEENLSQIYDRFKQLDSGTRKEFGGHGLGLSIVHALVDMLEGTVAIDTKVGEGSLFSIWLPSKDHIEDSIEDEILFDSEEKGETF